MYYCLQASRASKELGSYIKHFDILCEVSDDELISISDKQVFNEWGGGSRI